MNWFRNFFTNPNVHVAISSLASVATQVYPQYAPALVAVAAATGITGIALPEASAPAAAPVAPAGSLHQGDYINLLAAALVQAMQRPGESPKT